MQNPFREFSRIIKKRGHNLARNDILKYLKAKSV